MKLMMSRLNTDLLLFSGTTGFHELLEFMPEDAVLLLRPPFLVDSGTFLEHGMNVFPQIKMNQTLGLCSLTRLRCPNVKTPQVLV